MPQQDGDAAAAGTPQSVPVNMYEAERALVLVAPLPGVMVDDIEEQYKRLAAKGVEFTGRPEKKPWGGTLTHLKDLEGNVLTLMQEGKPTG